MQLGMSLTSLWILHFLKTISTFHGLTIAVITHVSHGAVCHGSFISPISLRPAVALIIEDFYVSSDPLELKSKLSAALDPIKQLYLIGQSSSVT